MNKCNAGGHMAACVSMAAQVGRILVLAHASLGLELP